MPAVALAILLGTLLGQFWYTPLPGGALFIVGLTCLLWWCSGGFCAALLLAWHLSGQHGIHYQQMLLPESLWSQDIEVRGCIDSLPRHTAFASSFTLRLGPDSPWGTKPRVRLRTLEPRPEWHAGQCHQLRVRLKPPHGRVNPGQFDRALWLYRAGVHAAGYVRASSAAHGGKRAADGDALLALRARLADRLHGWGGDRPAAAILPAIVVGVRSWITPAEWTVFQRTGTAHLMAISGLHVGLVALLGWRLGHALGGVLRRLWAGFDEARVGAGGCLLLAGSYAVLAGLSVPTRRALLMTGCVLLLRAALRRHAGPRALACVLAISCLTTPAAVLGAGFWMSFGAVAALLLIGTQAASADRAAGLEHPLEGWLARCGRALRTQLLLTLALAVPGLVVFGQLAWVAPVVNGLAIPWFAALILPAALAGGLLLPVLPVLAEPWLGLAAWALDSLLAVLRDISAVPLAAMPFGRLAGGSWLALGTAVACLLPPPPLRRIRTGCSALVLAFLLQRWPALPEHRLLILDVGQGTTALLVSGEHAVLFDTGPAWLGGDAGQQTVVPLLRYLGIHRLDAIVMSHSDADHAGGLASVRRAVPADLILAPPGLASVADSGHTCVRGQTHRFGLLTLHVEHPRRHQGWSQNDGSCVVTVQLGAAKLWFPGDIERNAEAVLAARSDHAAAELVIVPHHGSSTSSTAAFVAAATARYAIVTTGFLNRWRFPHPDVVQRWRSAGSCVLNTADTGALAFEIDPRRGLQLQSVAAASRWRPWVVRAPRPAPCRAVNTGNRGV